MDIIEYTKLLNRFGKRLEKAIALDFAKVKFDRENVRALTLMCFGQNDKIIKRSCFKTG